MGRQSGSSSVENAAILEWRAAKQGNVNLMLAYVKNVNGDKNPNYPDGVYVNIYKGDELLESHQVEIKVDKETLLETNIDDLAVEDNENIYVVVDGNQNNAYDGGLYSFIIEDATSDNVKKKNDSETNNANLEADFVEPGQGLNAAYKLIVAEDGKIVITGEYIKYANANDSNANGVCLRIF